MIYVGIDDTDTLNSPGTNKLARLLIDRVAVDYRCIVAVRHQLLFDPRVPYTSKNSSASILFSPREENVSETACAQHPSSRSDDRFQTRLRTLVRRLREAMVDHFVPGSDPGLCVTAGVPAAVTDFGRRCQTELCMQARARNLAREHGIHLEGLGGTEDGVIGALAAVGLLAGGNDGRVVNVGNHPDDLSGPQDATTLLARGVAEIRCVESGEPIRNGKIDVGKRLRPSYRDGRIVLFATASPEDAAETAPWRAVRFA